MSKDRRPTLTISDWLTLTESLIALKKSRYLLSIKRSAKIEFQDLKIEISRLDTWNCITIKLRPIYFDGLIDDEALYQTPTIKARTHTDTAVAVNAETIFLFFDENGDFGIIAIELSKLNKKRTN
jgi:hypothetical protein